MADRYAQLVNTPIGKLVAKQVGLPNPPTLERYSPGQPVISGPVLLGAAAGSRLAAPLAAALAALDAELPYPLSTFVADLRAALERTSFRQRMAAAAQDPAASADVAAHREQLRDA